jgi:hypothetical protein
MSVNDEFDLDSELSEVDTAPVEVPAKGKGKAKVKAEPEAVLVKADIDPEEDRENWPIIHIEMEDEKPNYEYLAAHGTMQNGQPFGHELQVMRGVDVAVPPSIVYALRDAISSHYSSRRDSSGKTSLVKQDRSAVPWRLVNPGPHVKPARAR